jgi:hypothetical protein
VTFRDESPKSRENRVALQRIPRGRRSRKLARLTLRCREPHSHGRSHRFKSCCAHEFPGTFGPFLALHGISALGRAPQGLRSAASLRAREAGRRGILLHLRDRLMAVTALRCREHRAPTPRGAAVVCVSKAEIQGRAIRRSRSASSPR